MAFQDGMYTARMSPSVNMACSLVAKSWQRDW